MPHTSINLVKFPYNKIVNQRRLRMHTMNRKMLELEVRCNCVVSNILIWRDKAGKATRVYIYDPNTDFVIDTLKNLDKVPFVIRHDSLSMSYEYYSHTSKAASALIDTRPVGRPSANARFRNSTDNSCSTIYDQFIKQNTKYNNTSSDNNQQQQDTEALSSTPTPNTTAPLCITHSSHHEMTTDLETTLPPKPYTYLNELDTQCPCAYCTGRTVEDEHFERLAHAVMSTGTVDCTVE